MHRLKDFFNWLIATKSRSGVQRIRSRLLAILLVIIIVLQVVLLFVNLYGTLFGTLTNATQFFISDTISLIVLIGLLLFNRYGFTTLAGALLILFITIIPGFVFLPEDLDRLLAIYVIPIVLSGFILHPLAVFAVLALSIGGYSYVFSTSSLSLTYNYIGVLILFVISTITWLVSTLLGSTLKEAQKNQDAQSEANQLLQSLQESLEQQVEERTRQIRTAADVAQTISSATSLKDVLEQTVSLIIERFGYYHAGIYLLDDEGIYAVLSAAAGQSANEFIAQSLRLKIEATSIVGWVSMSRQNHIASDVASDDRYLKNDLLPNTKSEAGIPMIAGERLLGVLDVQSQETNAFDEDAILTLQILARQTTAAIQNLRLVESTQVNLQSVNEVYRYGYMIAQANTEIDVYQATRRAVEETPFDAILLIAEESGFQVATSTVKDPLPEWINLQPAALEELFASGIVISEVEQLSTLPNPILRVLKQAKFQNVAILPVHRSGKLKAILAVGSQEDLLILPVAIQPYASMAELVISSLERIRGELAVESRLNELEAITVTSRALSAVTNLDALFSVLHEHVRKNMGDISFLVALYEPDTNSIRIPYMYENAPGSTKNSVESFPLGEGLTSILIRTKQPLMIVEDTERRAAALGARVTGKPAKSWLGTPLIVSNDVIGAIIVQDTERENVFDESDLRFLTTLSAQVAGAIYNIRLVEETRERALQLQTAAEIARDISGSLDVGELLAKAITLIRERFNFYHAAVFLIDPAGEYAIIREATGEAGAQMKRAGHKLKIGSKSIVGYVTGSGEHLVVNDTSRDATYYANPLLPDTRSEIAIPLKVGQRVLGALDVQSNDAYAFSTEDMNVLRILADQLAVAVINSELFAETQEHLSQHRLLHHVTTAAASGTTLEEALNSAAQGLQVTLGGDRVALLLTDREKKVLKVEATAGYSEEVKNVEVPFGEGITGWVAVHQQPQRINDVTADLRYIEIGSNVRSELAIPLSYRGELLGVLNVESDQPGAYSENDEELLGTLGGSLAAIIANARLLEQIRHQVDRERLLYEVTSKIRHSTDMQTIMATTASELSRALGARRTQITIDIGSESDSKTKNDQGK
jgi:GAF domain-containing protein